MTTYHVEIELGSKTQKSLNLIYLEIKHTRWHCIIVKKKKDKEGTSDIIATQRTVVKTCSIDPICMFN